MYLSNLVHIVVLHFFGQGEDLAAWKEVAENGGPTSASPPVTPAPKTFDKFSFQIPTPPIVQPYKKAQLSAAKRLEKELKQQAVKNVKKEKGGDQRVLDKSKKTDAKGKTTDAKGKKTETKGKKAESKGKKAETKKQSKGPMEEAKKDYMAEAKRQGLSYKDSLWAWSQSEERYNIVSSMSESERKRRRY